MDQSPLALSESKITIRKVHGNSKTNSISTKANRNLNVPPTADNNVPPVQSFICDVCKQSFPTKRGLNVHRNRHVKEANETTAGQ